MSWIQHKKPPALTSSPLLANVAPSSSSSSHSSLFLNSTHSSVNLNNSLYNESNRNDNSLRQASQTINNNTAQQVPSHSSLLMTSQYSSKTNNTIVKSPSPTTAMRLNSNSPYQQPLTQQQLQQQRQPPPAQRHHQQQQQQNQQQLLHNALQQPTSHHTTQKTTSNPNASHLQRVSNNGNQQQNSWPTQQTGFLPSTKIMHPTQALPPAVAAPETATNWPQQTIPQVHQDFQNSNMYQQNALAQEHQQWPQNPQQAPAYENYYQQQVAHNLYQEQPAAPQNVVQTNPVTYFQQQPTQQATQNQTNPLNFFDQSNNNQTSTGDGWSDWDWNENSTIAAQPAAPAATEHAQAETESNNQSMQQTTASNQAQTNYNCSIIADSFSTQTNNDSWNWDSNKNEQQVNNTDTQKMEKSQNDNWNWNNQNNEKEKLAAAALNSANEQHNENGNWPILNENQQHVATPEVNKVSAKTVQMAFSPPPPPLTEFSSTAASENHNYNTNIMGTPPNSIPNTVFVTQAKPVTLPSRQYASPPSGNTPVTENSIETALTPPQGFQNIEESYQIPAAVVSPALPAPSVATPPLANVVPPMGLPPAANTGGNPFKRSGVAQHHRATGLMTTTAPSSAGMPSASAVFTIPPPPPADFANPSEVSLIEPDNNELPSQENQEVLTPPTTQITLPNATGQPPAIISLPNTTAALAPPPPNDERNQYLQTSHLSENSEEQQPEADGLLPPPGLSRLVLGEPEFEASQQRMVMGTETPNADNAVSQASVMMHLEERHADGEDTASENAVPASVMMGQGVAPASSSLTSDRNLYLVPGESNNATNNQQQRVVTGVELAEQREIEMDGENLEDEQIQQQHFSHQQHHPQNQHPVLSAEARNEPPVEGAVDILAAASTLAPTSTSHATDQHLEQQHHSTNQLPKIKDSNPISSPNDDDDSDDRLLNDRGMTQSATGSSKSRTKYDNERLSAVSRRRDKRSSAERYESDEYLNSEGEYSSEREERERRERDRRRHYREGSVRSDRGIEETDKRSRGNRASNKRDKYYYEGEERSRGVRDDRERERGVERSKPERRSQRQRGYDADSRYETEESTRFDSRKDPTRHSIRRSDRSDQVADYDEYRRGGYRSSKRGEVNYESDRKDRRRSDKHREPRYREEPRYDPREYDDYRKHSSRNARESDMEKEGAVPLRSGRMHHDPRHASAMYGYPSGGYYDPYTAYYYQQMARTNPQAYAEWYKKYYGQAAAGVGTTQGVANVGHADTSLPVSGNDGRESVHSGRSSAHNDIKDRYTHAYITQANDYHRHYQQQQHLHQQHFHHQQQQQQHQQQMAFNHSLNSTMFDDENLNHNTILYSGLGGLSSARSNTNLSQIHGGFYIPATGSTAAGVYYARSDYAESRSGALSLRDPEPISQEPQRLTPCKFITEHTVVNFSSGILVTVKPKYTPNGSISNVVKLLKFKPNDDTRKLFKVFPGPLVRGLTHKKTVIEFCQEQIRLGPMETTIYAKQLITNNADKYRGSYTLMWNLLILLLKQNGMVVGTDIAELLLKNQQQFLYETPLSTANDSLKSKSGSASPIEELVASKEDTGEIVEPVNQIDNLAQTDLAKVKEKLQDQEEVEDSSLAKSSSDSMTLPEDEVTEKFRNYLLYGNVNEALEWATDNNLWGHALFLASKLDRRSHANVMMKFANKLSLNDPLQTLYQLMSGRTPSSVTCVQDEKWGDWRPHLSMILSNTSQKPELDRKAITTLGDSLFHRGDLYAAHFCYLMAQVSFGRYQEAATQESSLQQHLPKLVLLGSSHYKQFQDFAHNEAIIMTEIYEYACSLNDDKFSIVEFQPYKFLLASRLLDYGFHLKSLMYLEQIAVHISRGPSKYESSFINKVYEMADRLKYYDPVLEKTIDDQQTGSDENNGLSLTPQQMEEQKWLQNLRQLAQQYKNDFNISSSMTSNNTQDCQQQQLQDPNYYNQQQQQIDQQFMEINKQFSELNLQYQQQTAGQIEQQQHQQQQQEQQQPMFYNSEQHQQLQQEQAVLDPYIQQQQHTQSLQTEQLPIQNVKDLGENKMEGENLPEAYQQQQQQTQQQYLSNDIAPQSSAYSSGFYDPSQYNSVEGDGQQQPAAYDYWSQQQQQQQPAINQLAEENARPTISMPKSKTYDTDDETAANRQPQSANEANKKQQQKGAKKDEKEANKNQHQTNQNSGWFGGIWNKFSLKPKNQMILPDDKNPSIVWDPEKKKWVNTDGEEDAQEAFKPPPKLSDLMPQPQSQMPSQQQQQQTQSNQIPFMDPQQMQPQMQQYVPNSIPQTAPTPNPMQQQQQNFNQNQTQAPGPSKTPTLQSNMFKMQRNRTLKNAYVDVFNPSGAPINKAAENILAPALPPAAVPQGGFFIPGSQPGAGSSQELQQQQYQQQQQHQQTQQQDTPQFYNPNQFTSGTGY